MFKARRAGISWAAFVDRHGARTKALLVALPLLLLSVFLDHGIAGAAATQPGSRIDSSGQSSDLGRSAGAEGKALPGRKTGAIAGSPQAKHKLAGDGTHPETVLLQWVESQGPGLELSVPHGTDLPPAAQPSIAARSRAPPAYTA